VDQTPAAKPLQMAMQPVPACRTSRELHQSASQSAWLARSVPPTRRVSTRDVPIPVRVSAVEELAAKCSTTIPFALARPTSRAIHLWPAHRLRIQVAISLSQRTHACRPPADLTPFAKSNRTDQSAPVWPTTLVAHRTAGRSAR